MKPREMSPYNSMTCRIMTAAVGGLLLLFACTLLIPTQTQAQDQIERFRSPLDLTREEQDFLKKHRVFRVHVEREYHPFAYVEGGKARGFAVDLTDILARRLGIEMEYVTDETWEEGIEGLKQGTIDVVLAMVNTQKRREFTCFTDPFLTTYTGLATRNRTNAGHALEDMAGKKVGVVRGYWHQEIIQEHYPQIEVVAFADHISCLEALAAGEVAAVISSNPVLAYHIRRQYMLGLKTRLILGSEQFRSTKEGYGVRRDMPLLASALQKALGSMPEESLDELWRRWLIDNVAEPNSLVLSADEKRHLESVEELRLCIDPDWMPLEGLDQEGQYTGLSADYFALIQDQLPVPIRLVPTSSWIETMEKAASGECDLVSLISPTPSRREFLNFTRPYLHLPIVVATRGEEIFIENIQQVTGRRLGCTRGYAITEQFRKRYPAIEVVETESVAEGVRKIHKGEIYGFIGTVAAIGQAIRDQGLDDVKISGRVNMTLELAIGVRKDDPVLCDIMDKAIVALGPGEGQRLYNKWAAVTYKQGVNVWLVLWSAVGAVAVLTVIMWRNRRLAQLHRDLLRAHQELEEQSQELKRLSITDPLTGLYNRLKIEDSFKYEFRRLQRYGDVLAIILLDIDHFKNVNDTFGHQAGDQVLCGIADVLRHRVRKSDMLGRWGGEEFIIILPETGLEEAVDLAEELRMEIHRVAFDGIPPQSASFGVTTAKSSDNKTGAFQRVDRALYQAKENGRNMVVALD